MKVTGAIPEVRAHVRTARSAGRTVALVPTMGAFHAGHAALMRAAADACDEVVVSLFVNPTQFDESADFGAYPRVGDEDADLARAAGADLLFAPSVEEMYPAGFATTVTVAGLTEVLEGAHRPGHFAGVCTVVAKLLSIVAPDVAFFGQKDAQQLVVVRRMVSDLDLPVRIAALPTVREPDGLALSSRNRRLTPEDRGRSLALPRALSAARAAAEAGERDAARIRRRALDAAGDDIAFEYLEVVDPETLAPVDEIAGEVLVAAAARIGAVRLIDNVSVMPASTSPPPTRLTPAQEGQLMSATPRPDGSAPANDLRRVGLLDLAGKRERGEPIVMVTAYDFPSAQVAEEAGVDIVLVGDSAAMTVLGYESTVPVTVDELLVLCRAVRRGLRAPLLVGDLPFGSYERSDDQAIETAVRYVKEAGCEGVKIEGGMRSAERAHAIVAAGIPVMGHVGLTPQTATSLGGFRAQGRTAEAARRLLDDALAIQAAGCFSIVFEAMPAAVAERIMEHMEVPVIGIGAGPATDGQVLVVHDLLGIHTAFQPKFAKRFADVRREMVDGLSAFTRDVRERRFPASEHTYAMSPEELARLDELIAPES